MSNLITLCNQSMDSNLSTEEFFDDLKKNPTKYYCFTYEELAKYSSLLVDDVFLHLPYSIEMKKAQAAVKSKYNL